MKWQPTVDFKIMLGEHGVQPVFTQPPIEREREDFPGMSRPKPKRVFKDRHGRRFTWDGRPKKQFT